MMEHEILLKALTSEFGLIVQGSAKALRTARSTMMRDDIAVDDLAVLGPDTSGHVWVVRKSVVRALTNSDKEAR
jgi:hypothetical protein